MIYRLSGIIVDYLNSKNLLKNDKEYYFESTCLLLSIFLTTIILFILGIIFNRIIEAILFEVIILSSRYIMGGYQCRRYETNIILYVSLFIFGTRTLNIYNFDIYVFVIIQIWALIITAICAPVPTAHKDVSRRKRIILKICSIIYLLVYLFILNILYYNHHQYVNIFIYILLIINISMVIGVINFEEFEE